MIPHKKNPRNQLENYSKIFLQIGLVLVLFVTHLVIENVITEKKAFDPNPPESDLITYDFEPIPFERYKEPPKKVAQNRPKQKRILKIIKKDNSPKTPIRSLTEKSPLVPPSRISNSQSNKKPEVVAKPAKSAYDYSMVTPLFRGCKDISKAENRACFDRKMKKFVQKKFAPEISKGLHLQEGDHKIFVQFIIDKKGEVIDVKIRAPHPKLHKEVARMIQKLPKFTPGKVGGKNVNVKYLLPINFRVD